MAILLESKPTAYSNPQSPHDKGWCFLMLLFLWPIVSNCHYIQWRSPFFSSWCSFQKNQRHLFDRLKRCFCQSLSESKWKSTGAPNRPDLGPGFPDSHLTLRETKVVTTNDLRSIGPGIWWTSRLPGQQPMELYNLKSYDILKECHTTGADTSTFWRWFFWLKGARPWRR